ncbi:hypothetical protein SCARD494_05680 [Seiridium cardinale]
MARFSEVARERETYKFTARLFEHARAHPTATATPTGDEADHRLFTSTCEDTALTAFAQLGAFRLNATRCLISIFDRRNQYVVAEATFTSAIARSASHGDDLWLGGTAIPRAMGICEHVLIDGNNSPTTQGQLQVSVVPDMTHDSRFSDRPYINNHPYNRFYAGVPIRSPRGVNIGVFCVFDDRPREGLDDSQLQFLRDMSQTVMDHWELRASATNFRKSERMVRGLGSFVEGKATMSGWRFNSNQESFSDAGDEGHLNRNQQIIENREEQLKKEAGDIYPRRPDPTPLQSGYHQGGSGSTVKTERIQNSDNQIPENASSAAISIGSTISTVQTHATVHAEEPIIKAVHDVFGRAANIIREAIEVEGVLFLDASVGSFGGLVPDQEVTFSDSSAPSLSTAGGGNDGPAEEDANHRLCNLLGYSTTSTSSIDDTLSTKSHNAMVPEKFLRSLLKRYPGGRVFNFDDDGTVQSTDEDSGFSKDESILLKRTNSSNNECPTSPTKKPDKLFSRKNEGKTLNSLFPEARCVALVPLWDARRERWFAGSFLWTKIPTRSFTAKGEMSYLRAFGATIMAEIIRLDSSLAEKATSDLLGSLSHELRSPLHGVIAAVELLQDTDIDAFQGNLVHTMESCGRTLLDSMDHLLDYTKINRLLKDQRQTSGRAIPSGRLRSFESQMTSFSSTIELDLLVEETVESIFAGHNFHKMSIAQLVQNERQHHRDVDSLRKLDFALSVEALSMEGIDLQTLMSDRDVVSIYLDIDPKVSWLWHATPGAIRRIIMNLLGNSLKFTKRGFILVTLKQEQVSPRTRRGQINLKLNVSDSGKGIAPDFLHNRAFKPFSQEDALSPGSGLGLSIVHQITKALGGWVKIESQPQRGTSVSVTIPLQLPSSSLKPQSPSLFSDHVTALRGLRVALYGLDNMPEAPGISSQDPPIESLLMESLCRDWLQLEIITADTEDVRPDVIICTDSSLARTGPATPTGYQPPIVAICHNALAAHNLSQQYSNSYGKGIFEFISQPASPRKLASAIVLALGRYDDSRATYLLAMRTSISSQSTSDRSSLISSAMPTPMTEQITPLLEDPQASELAFAWSPLKTEPDTSVEREPELNSPLPESRTDTIVSITPATPTPSVTPQPPTGSPDADNSIGSKFLLVDDNNINLRILESFMKKLNYSYRTATNGLEALEIYAASPEKFGQVLMDISMPVMDGLEATRRIRELELMQQLKPVTIIALTGLASANAQQEAYTSGINLYMTKPVRFKELAKVLASKDKRENPD